MKKRDRTLRAKKFDYILDEYLSATEVSKGVGYDSPNMVYKLKHNDYHLTELISKFLNIKFSIPPKVLIIALHLIDTIPLCRYFDRTGLSKNGFTWYFDQLVIHLFKNLNFGETLGGSGISF